MSVLAQISIVFMIVITSVILFYANKGLRMAAEEGEAADFRRGESTDYMDRDNNESSEYKKEKSPYYLDDNWDDWDSFEDSDDKQTHEEEIKLSPVKERKNINEDRFRISPEKMEQLVPEYVLTVEDEDQNELGQVEIDHYPFSIGRDPENDLELGDLCVARFHCDILMDRGRVFLKDKGSVNKIFVDGRQTDHWVLRDGGHFYLGNMKIYVSEKQGRSQPTILAYKPERMSVG